MLTSDVPNATLLDAANLTYPPLAPKSEHSISNVEGVALSETEAPSKRDLRFWLIFVALTVSTFLAAIDMTSASVALPTIISELHGKEFVWVGSAYSLGSTAFLPLSGGLAQTLGRRPVMLGSLVLFALGSGICGGAKSMAMLIGGRTVQGIGSGGILSLTQIIFADLVPLRERGAFMGLIGAVWALASAIGPPVGGAFSEWNWRWLFYINLPLCAVAIGLVFAFLNLKAPEHDLRTKLMRVDWGGNIIMIISSSIVITALTWGGVKYPWNSYQVLVPLILGIVGFGAFILYEKYIASEPVVPWKLIKNRTSVSGYIGTALQGIVFSAVFYYLPVYLQSSKGQSPVDSGLSLFGIALTIAPAGIAVGASIAKLGMYRPQNFIGWVLIIIGTGLLSLLDSQSTTGEYIGYQIVHGLGIGIMFPATNIVTLAAVPVSESAHALALFSFFRTFSQTWGVTIGSSILQNQLKKTLPSEFLATLPLYLPVSRSLLARFPRSPICSNRSKRRFKTHFPKVSD